MLPDLRERLQATFRWTDVGDDLLVSDRSGWWRDPIVLGSVGAGLAGLFPGAAPTVVVSPEVTGFLLGPLVAVACDAGFVEVYRAGARRPTAEPMIWADVPADHRGDAQRLGARRALLTSDDRVLVVDDWASTGAQIRALARLITTAGATYLGGAVIVDECPAAVSAELTVRGLLTGADL
ncbi:phosphoribosyltransferase family protein [Mangrovihabitans endophyticus]|uniref:Adenine phosphoribosyltransferase n=1 Tax=Mangrovihabitans endophyticus TaxID=1751298 RepID=A0A8J3BZV0_9ACTN|nr:phosphoribosyltransferase family protein [Mangrovihabitans endophyticus]GGK95027.1 adenine phosphoribosyltransferase [Mangrovihabitans endophyticus]